jgi:late competence protein required for DNA uptake (superfamily II DNA/RNA helicase)
MKYVLIALFAIVISIEIAFPVRALSMPPVDEIEMMMAKIKSNLQMASQLTQMAQSKSAALVAQKQQEKADLKEAVVAAEQKSEMFAAKMIANGIDTTTVEVPMTGPAYDAYLNYIEEGGKDDFDYFRMYLWQQK